MWWVTSRCEARRLLLLGMPPEAVRAMFAVDADEVRRMVMAPREQP